MATFAVENHQINFGDELDHIYVINTSTSTQVASYALSSAYSIEVEVDDYVINATSVSGTLYGQGFDPDNDDAFGITLRAGIGISDLRTTRSEFTYNLEGCPIIVKNEYGVLHVYSPCSGSCTQPSSECCSIKEIE